MMKVTVTSLEANLSSWAYVWLSGECAICFHVAKHKRNLYHFIRYIMEHCFNLGERNTSSTSWRSLHSSILFPHPFCLIGGCFFLFYYFFLILLSFTLQYCILFCSGFFWWNFDWRIFSRKWFHCLLWIVKWHRAVKWNFPSMNLCEIQGLLGGACQCRTLCWVFHNQPQLVYLTALWYGMMSFICGQEKWERS